MEDPVRASQLLATVGTEVLEFEKALKRIDAVSVAQVQQVAASLQKAGSVVVAGGDVRGVGRV
jgi:predicted Zn-dependent peptidase